MYLFKTNSPDETFKLGKQVASLVSGGDTICLSGNLGAGKTVFVQGIASNLNIEDNVTSPTFNILNLYQGNLTVYHFDLYRLECPSQLDDIGFYEYIADNDALSVVEWPDRFTEELPDEYLWVEIKTGINTDERLFLFKPKGKHYQQLCEELKLTHDSFFRYIDPSV